MSTIALIYVVALAIDDRWFLFIFDREDYYVYEAADIEVELDYIREGFQKCLTKNNNSEKECGHWMIKYAIKSGELNVIETQERVYYLKQND